MRKTMRRVKSLLTLVAVAAGVVLALRAISDARSDAAAATGWAPAVPVGEARQQLAELRVAPRAPVAGYDRGLFRHWIPIQGVCNTRETVLKRDGEGVEVGSDCAPTSGSWVSPYDGATWTRASDVDTDHLVPLAQAWVSGAARWSPARRQAFANDLSRPQLVTVTDNVNEAKGGSAPDQWKPPLKTTWCAYAVDWVVVKHHYQLTVTGRERAALASMLDRC
jgi:hypothetical protein